MLRENQYSYLAIAKHQEMGSKKKSKQMKEETADIDNLEQLHNTMKREREAWEKLIENLHELQIKNKNRGPENPSNR